VTGLTAVEVLAPTWLSCASLLFWTAFGLHAEHTDIKFQALPAM
jgi:hypothetical protein